jgi:hypothetical protein
LRSPRVEPLRAQQPYRAAAPSAQYSVPMDSHASRPRLALGQQIRTTRELPRNSPTYLYFAGSSSNFKSLKRTSSAPPE